MAATGGSTRSRLAPANSSCTGSCRASGASSLPSQCTSSTPSRTPPPGQSIAPRRTSLDGACGCRALCCRSPRTGKSRRSGASRGTRRASSPAAFGPGASIPTTLAKCACGSASSQAPAHRWKASSMPRWRARSSTSSCFASFLACRCCNTTPRRSGVTTQCGRPTTSTPTCSCPIRSARSTRARQSKHFLQQSTKGASLEARIQRVTIDCREFIRFGGA
mmetsp:Transcript_25241/g.71332  ORF Transcript_25241/g.71332 Transcript_25241/m.71332 type:complete len:220 (-) Transcript_25241:1786-2445(-)